jgi:PAT family beta-lactamase induction signal transducer AmpG
VSGLAIGARRMDDDRPKPALRSGCAYGRRVSTTAPETEPRGTAATRRARELGWTTSAYFGEGLPYSILHMLLTEYLTAIGAPASEVGYTSWFHVPVTAKPLLSPIVDLVGSKRRDRKSHV